VAVARAQVQFMRQQGYSFCVVVAGQVMDMNTAHNADSSITTASVTISDITIADMLDTGNCLKPFDSLAKLRNTRHRET